MKSRQRGPIGLIAVAVMLSMLVPASVGTVAAQGGATHIDAHFDSGQDGFAYRDDAFRGTNQPTYALGTYESSGGYNGGGLRVNVGAVNGDDINGMSGGWEETFTLGAPATVTVSFWYNLSMSSEYESDEYGEALVRLNSTLYGSGSNDYVARMAGNGNGGSTESTGWQQFVFSASLGTGDYTLAIGGYNNRKTYSDEWTEVLIDNVLVTSGNAPPVADAGPDHSVIDSDGNGTESVTLDGSGSYDVDGPIVDYQWSVGVSGATPTVSLGVGTHTITLTVEDDEGATDSDDVVITVSELSDAFELVSRLDLDRFKSNIKTLNDFGDRCRYDFSDCNYPSDSYQNAQNWIEDELQAEGYQVLRHHFTTSSGARSNLYATKEGVVHPDQIYIVSAHLDGRGGGGAADDNGSGSSLVLEAARAFASPDVQTDVSIRFVWWDQEERGISGSGAYADNPPAPTDRSKWLGMIAYDMVLYDHGTAIPQPAEQIPGADLDLEYRAGTAYASPSRDLANSMAAAAATYSDYPAEVNDYSVYTDDTNFWDRCPSYSVRENRRSTEMGPPFTGEIHPYYHTSGDVYENYTDLDFLMGFSAVKMSVGALAEWTNAQIISANNPPVAADDAHGVDEDGTLNITPPGVLANDTDAEGDPLTAILVGDAGNGTLALNADGSFTYTPAPDYFGSDSFTYRANDGSANSNQATVSITVNGVNDPPLAVDDAFGTEEDTTLNVAAPGVLSNDTDVDGNPLSAILESDVSHGDLTLNGNGSFSYTPDPGYFSLDSFTYVANDGTGDSNTATVTIEVTDVNDPPVAVDDSDSTTEDAAVNVDVLANDTDAEGDPLTIGVTGETNGTATVDDGGTPADPTDDTVDFVPAADSFGTAGFTYLVNDGTHDSNEATVTITVDPVNDAPLADDDAATTEQDTPVNIDVLANDTDLEDDPLTISIIDDTNGTATVNSGGTPADPTDDTVDFDPAAGFFGATTFTYRVNDGALSSNIATVDVTVTRVNNLPAANDDAYSVNEDLSLSVGAPGVLGNDSDADSDTLTAVLDSGVGHGTLDLNSDGSFTYTPDPDFSGGDGFTYHANDSIGDSNVATVAITVNAVNDDPVADDQSVTTDEDTAVAITLTGSDVDPDTLSYAVSTQPLNGTLSGTAPNLAYTPAANYNGSDGFTFQVSDGNGGSDEATVTITVNPVNDPPLAVDDTATLDEDWPVTISVLANDSDVDLDTLDVTSVTQPAHGTAGINPADTVGYSPDANFCGSDTFTYILSDGNGGSDGATVSLTVECENDTPVAQDQSVSTTQGTAVDITLQASDVEGTSLSYAVVAGPSHGTLSGTAPDLTYTPDGGYTGADSFTFQASDGNLDSNVATVSITVNPSGPSVVFEDDFETDQGWVVNPSRTDTATTGMWERANPQDTSYNGAKQLGTTVSGSFDLVTGPLAGNNVGTYDIDKGVTSVRSPAITLPAGQDLVLSFSYYMAHTSNSSSEDFFRVSVVGDSTLTVLGELGARNDDDAAWEAFSTGLNSFAGQTIYLLVEAADLGGGSIVEAAIDDLSIVAKPPATAILEATFDAGTGGFVYDDDRFRGTNQPGYASGTWLSSGGRSGGGLQVYLGGLDNNSINGMSGGWQGSFTLADPADVILSFWYNLTQAPDYETDEYSQALVSVDGALVGEGAADYVSQISGDGNGGDPRTTGWRLYQVNLGTLPAGQHSLVIGGYNNKKTYNNEWTEVLVDDLVVSVR